MLCMLLNVILWVSVMYFFICWCYDMEWFFYDICISDYVWINIELFNVCYYSL